MTVPMSEDGTYQTVTRSEWPSFTLKYTFNPKDIAPDATFEPNEAVMYDESDRREGRWISAKYGSYISITEVR